MATVFDIKEGYREVENMINTLDENGECAFSQDQINDYINQLDGLKEEKLENIEYLKKEYLGDVNTLAEEIKRLQARKKSRENTIKDLNELQLDLLNGEKVKTAKFTFSFRKTESVEVLSDKDIKDDKTLNKVTIKPDLTAIKKAIKAGRTFEGISIVEKTSLLVRYLSLKIKNQI